MRSKYYLGVVANLTNINIIISNNIQTDEIYEPLIHLSPHHETSDIVLETEIE